MEQMFSMNQKEREKKKDIINLKDIKSLFQCIYAFYSLTDRATDKRFIEKMLIIIFAFCSLTDTLTAKFVRKIDIINIADGQTEGYM